MFIDRCASLAVKMRAFARALVSPLTWSRQARGNSGTGEPKMLTEMMRTERKLSTKHVPLTAEERTRHLDAYARRIATLLSRGNVPLQMGFFADEQAVAEIRRRVEQYEF